MIALLRQPRVLGVLAVVAACSPARFNREEGTLSFPARVAEGTPQQEDAGAAGDASPDAAPAPTPTGSLPDPAALKEPNHWEYEFRYDRGKVSVGSVRLRRFSKPIPTIRTMGRWALELWIGKELVDRVRFDFPMLGAEEPPAPRRPLHEPPTLAAGATVTRRVLIPASPRATRAVLVDRATGESIELPWPPDAPLGPPRTRIADGGAGGASP